jgi:SAM-dependent methyltransferase
MRYVLLIFLLFVLLWAPHQISYFFLKKRIVRRQRWDLNICCGRTDGSGINADIVPHPEVPRFEIIRDIYRLPFSDRQFDSVLCSHTIEHVEDPDRFLDELRRVGEKVVLVLPPLWDITAALNVFEHRWLFFCLKKEHTRLPRRVRLPLSTTVQRIWGQRIHS